MISAVSSPRSWRRCFLLKCFLLKCLPKADSFCRTRMKNHGEMPRAAAWGSFSVQIVGRCEADGEAGGERTTVSDLGTPGFSHRIATERAVMQETSYAIPVTISLLT